MAPYPPGRPAGSAASLAPTKDYAGWLVPVIQYRRIKQQSWELFAADMDNLLIWRRTLRRSSKGGAWPDRLARPWSA